MTKIQFELDGKQVEAKAGETIWQVAKRHSVTRTLSLSICTVGVAAIVILDPLENI